MKTLTFQSTIIESEKINPLFTKVKIRVAYEGKNRNQSYISKETFEKASSSAKFTPIVGEWSESVEDFLGHGGKVEIKDDSVKFIRTTIPYGVISDDAPVWETVNNADGTSKEYFTLYGYIWSGRYQELESIIEEGSKSHSMEIEVLNGKFEKINGEKLYVIDDMVFSGFCILGNDVEPCFESSTISTFSLDKKNFQQDFKQMMAELKFSLHNYMKGGNTMEETKTEEVVQEQFESTEEVKEQQEFKETEVTVEVEDEKDDESSEENETEGESEDKEEKYSVVESELTELKEKYSLLESEVSELREFKASKLQEEKEIQINEVFSSVASQLSEDELAPFKSKAFEIEVSELKKELFALIGEKELSKTKQETKTASFSMSILNDIPSETTISGSYDSIIKKYNK